MPTDLIAARRGGVTWKPMCVSALVYTYVVLSARRRVLAPCYATSSSIATALENAKDRALDFGLREVRFTG